MNLTLQPQASFTVVRQIANHLDTDTNYVRAVIRNAYTDAIIDTLDLTGRGAQRFSKNWQVPADPGGQGFYVSIVTSVYTDSAYTTKNGNYGDEESTYLVQDRLLLPRAGGDGGIDAYTVRRIIKEELDKRAPEEKPQEPKDHKEETVPQERPDRTDEILQAIRDNRTEATPPTDLGPVLSEIQGVKQAIEDKEVTDPTDLNPILDAMRDDAEVDDRDFEELKGLLTAIETRVLETVGSEITKALAQTNFISTFTTQAAPRKQEPTEAEKPKVDVAKFAL